MNDTAQDIITRCRAQKLTLACAESLTGGLVCAELTSVPGASAVLLGGVVVYSTDSKREVLGVDGRVLARVGPVSAQVAGQMATLVADRFGADVGIATTGVAGPGAVDAHPVGEVFVAVHSRDIGTVVHRHEFAGSRAQIRSATVAAAMAAVSELLRAGVSEQKR